MENNLKVLFILKQREDYNTNILNFTSYTVATGMFNSASFVNDMLNENNIESSCIFVNDNNDIDKEVSIFKPTHVFVEGFWIVPEKFDELIHLHPNVKWIIRCHSEMPFLAQEGIAIEWIYGYLSRNIGVSGNSIRINRELRLLAKSLNINEIEKLIPLLTNYYPVNSEIKYKQKSIDKIINVGCFGAFRPLKNNLIQAVAAIDYAERNGLTLIFHINSGREEMNGNNVMKNIRALFACSLKHTLIEHPWASHEDFLNILLQMDICLQVSFTETFNIVAADSVNLGIPTLVSSEINWVHEPYANPTNSSDIVEKIGFVLSYHKQLNKLNRKRLKKYSKNSNILWIDFLTNNNKQCFLLEVLGKFKNLLKKIIGYN